MPVILVVALAVRVAAAVRLSPASDVYYYLSQAVQVLLSGANPYQHAYTGIPASLITPGAQQVFAYLPFTMLYLVPFYLAGDIRLGLIAADLAIGACLYLYGGRWRLGATLLYLFVPFTVLFSTFYVNAALIAMAFVAVFLLLESKGMGRLGAVSLGLALATVQFALLIAPFALFYYAEKKRWVELATAVVVAGAVILPFLLVSPSFLNETFLFQFQRPVAPLFASGGPVGVLLNPTLAALSVSLFGFAAPVYVKAAVEVVLLAFLIRVTDLSNLNRNSTLFIIVSVFVLPNDFFWVYLELPFMLALFWLSAPKDLAFVKRD
ncbi:MAG: hypothetical protein OK449_03130 [Thaumarchaeota archaeon]|nr:hypothetical protein [Nitrososphaerota archaeon]